MSAVPENAETIKIILFYKMLGKYTLILDHRESVIHIMNKSGEKSRVLGDSEVDQVMSYLDSLTPNFGNSINNTEFDLTVESFEFSAIIKWNGKEDTPRYNLACYIHEILGG
jgi:hypothetical protein